MAKVANRIKIAVLKGMEAVGKSASNLASNAQLKVSEINLESRRREILSEFPLRAHDLWLKGVELPEPLGGMMAELNDLDERLSVLRAQRYARVEPHAADDHADDTAECEAQAPDGADVAAECEAQAPDGAGEACEYAVETGEACDGETAGETGEAPDDPGAQEVRVESGEGDNA